MLRGDYSIDEEDNDSEEEGAEATESGPGNEKGRPHLNWFEIQFEEGTPV